MDNPEQSDVVCGKITPAGCKPESNRPDCKYEETQVVEPDPAENIRQPSECDKKRGCDNIVTEKDPEEILKRCERFNPDTIENRRK